MTSSTADINRYIVPITCAAIMVNASHWVGFTLPA